MSEELEIKTMKAGSHYVASDGVVSCIGKTEEDAIQGVKDMQELNKKIPSQEPQVKDNSAPLENSKDGHPFDPFGGTSWAGKPNGFN